MRWLAALLVAVSIGLPAGASAAGGPSSSPARASDGGLRLKPAMVNGSVGAIISDASWGISGAVPTYVPGQRVTLHVFKNGVRIISRTVRIRRKGQHGVFSASLLVGGVGRLTVRAVHLATPAQGSIAWRAYSLWLVAPQAQPGERSYAVRILQHQLSALHYVVGVPGVYDDRTQRAVLAFRKMAGLVRNEQADPSVFEALAAGEGAFTVRFPSHGRHVEGDLTHQVLALIGANGVVQQLYPLSSGKPSTPTALGSFTVYDKTPGINSDGMVDSNYFNGGDAIHGYAEVPTYAASHGCLRVPIPDASTIYGWVEIGTPVDVYYR
jgi:peptidoglycan hydrolase-like protein with peptidoglycan-binding domain